MSTTRNIPTADTVDVPTFSIKTNGKEIPIDYMVASVTVTRQVNKIATAQVILFDGTPAEEDFPISNGKEFIPDSKIEISAGYRSKEKTIFKGIIVRQSIEIFNDRPSILKVECKHEAVKLTVGRKNAYFYDKKDSDIIKSVGAASGVSVKVKATKVKHPEMVQFYATDWDFLMSRAEANGMFAFTEDGGKLNIEPPDFGKKPAVSVLYGATMFSFEAEMDARSQYASVKATSWDSASQKLKEAKGSKPSVTSPGNIKSDKLSDVVGLSDFELRHGGQITDQELKEWANAQWLKSQLSKVRGRVRFQGFPDILPGDMIDLGGVGDRFNGKAFVSGVRHEVNGEGWETDVSFGMDPEWFSRQHEDIMSLPAEGLLPAVRGLQIGIVTKLEEDPDGADRVQVRIPMIDSKGNGVWARVASLDAGKERGTFFRPEINDEVVLGFLEDDPRHPVILGQLHSSKHPAPVKVKDTNHEKGIYTRSKIKMVFNDEDKSYTLETPGKNTIIVSDKDKAITVQDQHGNKIVLDDKGITAESSKDLVLKASGKISMEAGQDITIKAGTALKAESGTDLGLKAGTQLKAEGAAGAELKTSAIATIKGSLVKIN